MSKQRKISISSLELSTIWKSVTYDLSVTIAIVSILSVAGNLLDISYLMTWANPWHMSIPTSCLFFLFAAAFYLPTNKRRIVAICILIAAISCRIINYPGYAISTTTMQCFFALALLFSNKKASLVCIVIPLWICFVGFSVSFLKIQIPMMESFIRQMSVPTMVSGIMSSILLIYAPLPKALKVDSINRKTIKNAFIVIGFWMFVAILIHYSSASISQSIFAALLAAAVAYMHILMQSRAQLREFNHDLELALNKTSSLIIVNPRGKILYANDHYYKQINEPIGSSRVLYYQDNLLSPSDRNAFIGKLKDLSEDQTWHRDFCYTNAKGTPYWEETIITPIKNGGESSGKYLVITYDITQRVQQSKNLEEHQKELYQLLENNASLIHMKSTLMQVSTHKMKAPLMKVLSDIETMIIKTSPRDNTYAQLGSIKRKTKKVIKELNELLKFEAETQKERYYNLSKFNLAELLYSEIEVSKQEIENKHLNFDYSCPTDKSIYHAKPALEHIIRILLRNAFERSTEHGLVRISLDVDKENLYISTEDRGNSIPESMQDKLFNAFHTRNLISSEDKIPLGLGLSFVKELTHGLKGTIELQNLTPKGICLKVALPLKHSLEDIESTEQQEHQEIK